MISIIVPVYNSEKYLERCINSILNQTYADFELVLINDGSIDNSGRICDSFAKKDSRIKTIHQTNKGQAEARNRGVIESSGEWLCFVDSDDCINPWYLEYLYRAVLENDVNISACGFIEADCIKESFFEKQEYFSVCYKINDGNTVILQKKHSNTYWTVWGKLILRSIVCDNLFKTGKIYEDNEVAPKWLYESKKIAVIDLPLYFYTINESGTTKNSFSEKKLDLLWALEEQIKFLDSISFSNTKMEIVILYMNSSISLSKSIEKELGMKKKSKQILSNSKRVVREYISKEKLSRKEKETVFQFLHPKMSKLMKILRW